MLGEHDHALLLWLNQLARQSVLFDELAANLSDRPSVKFLPIVACLIWLWFRDESQMQGRIAVGQALLGSLVAMAATKLVQALLPPNPRPLHDPSVTFVEPFGGGGDILADPSSFPSDTAALAFALAAGVLMGSRPLGCMALLWAAIVVSLPRIYFGYHYPSDIAAGAAIGVASVLVLRASGVWERIAASLSAVAARRPGLFYIAGFVVLFQLVTSFIDVRRLGWSAARVASELL